MKSKFVRRDTFICIIGPLQGQEFTLCGVAFDAADSEEDETLRFHPTNRRVVTCPECANVVLACRNVKVAQP
jgi:hypothetical protein